MSVLSDVTQSVLGGQEIVTGIALGSVQTASNALTALSNLVLPAPPQITAPGFSNINFSFELPSDPLLPKLDTSLEAVPSAPNIDLPSYEAAFPRAPVLSAIAPTLDTAPRPDGLRDSAPLPPSIQYDISVPDAPVITLPELPALTGTEIPTAPVLSIPSFTAVAPVPAISRVSESFNYIEPTYLRAIELRSVIERMLAGESGLPPAIEAALFDRARGREDIVARKAVQEATEEFSARGFSLPQGELARRVDEVRQRNQDASNTLQREILIRVHEAKLQDLRFAVQQALSYEGQMIELHNQAAGRALQSAELGVRLAIESANLEVAIYNTYLAAFNAKLETRRVLLLENGQRLELFRGQLEASRALGEVNEQRVRLYTEQVRAQITGIEIYKAQVEGAQARVGLARAQAEEFRGRIEGYSAQVSAKRAEFEAWGEQVRAEGQKADIYRASVSAFAEQVRAYSSGVEAAIAPIRARSDSQRLQIEAFQAQLAAVRERINARGQQMQAFGLLFDGQARIHSTKVGAYGEKARAVIAAYSAQIDATRAAASVSIENARVVSENAGRNAALVVEAQKGVAQVAGQIASGALSAINVSSSLSAGASFSNGASLSVGYSVDGGEAPPPSIPL